MNCTRVAEGLSVFTQRSECEVSWAVCDRTRSMANVSLSLNTLVVQAVAVSCWFIGSDYACYFDTRLSYVGVRWWPLVLQPGKGKVHPRTGHEGPEGGGSRCVALLFLHSRRWMGLGGQRHAPAALPPVKTRYPLYRRLGGSQGWSGRVRKISPPPPGFDPRTVQPVASRCTICAIPAPLTTRAVIKKERV